MHDVLIIGGGAAGCSAAMRARDLGLRVACIEGADRLGGSYVNTGAVPARHLLRASAMHASRALGIVGNGAETRSSPDIPAIMAAKDAVIGQMAEQLHGSFRARGIDWIRGRGHLSAEGKVHVEDHLGQKGPLEATHVIVATGSEPVIPSGINVDQRTILTSEAALALDSVPYSLMIVGAGPVGLQLGLIWCRFGTKVTIVERNERILSDADPEAALVLQNALSKLGIKFLLGMKLVDAVASGDHVDVVLRGAADGKVRKLRFHRLLIAAGRRPRVDLRDVGQSVWASRQWAAHRPDAPKTLSPEIWIAGDAALGPEFVHKAQEEGEAIIDRIVGAPSSIDYEVIPKVVATAPEVAWVGKTEEQLRSEGIDYRVGHALFASNDAALIDQNDEGFVKIIADAAAGYVLGVHMVGEAVSEIIGELCVAMTFGATADDIARTCHIRLSRADAIRRAAMDVASSERERFSRND